MRKLLTLALLLASLVLTPNAHAAQGAVLNVVMVTELDDGSYELLLKSGTKLVVGGVDYSPEWSQVVTEAMREHRIENIGKPKAQTRRYRPADPGPRVPSDAEAKSIIRSFCADKWSGDFQMRKYCEDTQFEALRSMRARRMVGELARVRAQCAEKWGVDFSMRDYCESEQLKAYRQLQD